MSDEVYEGAIGIDLGTNAPRSLGGKRGLKCLLLQARHILALPTMKGQTSKSVLSPSPILVQSLANIVLPVANEQGSFTTPSFVSFTYDERLIGESAKNQAAMNPANTIFDIKSEENRLLDLPNCKAHCVQTLNWAAI